MRILLGLLLVSLASFIALNPSFLSSFNPPVQAEATVLGAQVEPPLQPIKTDSQFSEKMVEDSTPLPFKTIYKDDPETEAGTETVLDAGKEGKKTTVTKITYHLQDEYDREIIGTDIIPPQDKIVLRGTKIIWKTLEVGGTTIQYWKRMRVYATHYDHNCPGCNDWTAIGMRATKGVVAVDPSVIKMRTKMYVPGYGMAIAGDTGGAIKGNIIDLCFDDARTAGWYAHFIDIYLLD